MTLRIGLLAAASMLALAGAASAADLPARVPAAAPQPYVAPLPVFTWTGFYVGVNAGAGFNSNNSPAYTSSGFAPAPTIYTPGSNTNTRFLGGGQAGFNWQTGALVFGVETDIQGVAKGTNSVGVATGAAPYAVVTNGTGPSWFGTVRGRAGIAMDRALFFATGGLAYGGGGTNASVAYFGAAGAPGTVYTPNSNGTKVGWTLGGGVEYALTNKWSLKGEYDYISLGHNNGNTFTGGAAGTSFSSTNSGDQFHVVRGGLNYKF